MKKQLRNVKNVFFEHPVNKVGLIIDQSHFIETNALIQEIINNGIAENNIQTIVYRDNIKDNETFPLPTFGLKDLNLKGEFKEKAINEFISDEFDLLISYYIEEKAFLLHLTNSSKAKFKTGFATVDKRLNHLLIDTQPENYKEFINELFRYLKILNKI